MSAGAKVSLEMAQRVARALHVLLCDACEQIVTAGSIRRQKPKVGDVELVCVPRVEGVPETSDQSDMFAHPKLRITNLLLARLDALASERSWRADLGEWGSGRTDWAPPEAEGAHWHLERGDKWGLRYRQLLVDWYERPRQEGWLDEPRRSDGWPLCADVFCADRDQIGYILLLRTGSAEFSRWFVTQLHRCKLKGHEGSIRRMANVKTKTPDLSASGLVPTPTEESAFSAARMAFIPPKDRCIRNGELPSEAEARWTAGGG